LPSNGYLSFHLTSHPSSASAPPEKIKTHEISVKMNKRRQILKTIRDITDKNLEKDNEIFYSFWCKHF